jgi:hypothetical protein
MRRLLQALFGLRRAVRGEAKQRGPAPVADARVAHDPWFSATLALLGERYQLGEDGPDGTRLLRRTGRARFNPMPVWLRSDSKRVAGDYEVRAHGPAAADEARRLLDARVTAPLAALGLAPSRESIEDWAGTVLTRRYEGACSEPAQAAAAVRFFCVESDLQIDTASE